ncbi:hydrogen peroxide-inducible genes activator [Parahaliea aestuarii]|uniref:LysR family transcriptional regulator n=1 Tax=Parahaliea aestuarii TaxID=1852021 RepID=A0A5C8ZXS4_9GAMM|nr:hydrogen peroxide-inducible genes activator [Parahaliea aestuarii]TXS92392.1 LysR family transcriptional regulator [Parahaliea aestuarii]
MVSLKQLTYALAVEKTRHFKKASELCSVSQSALSTAISEMESQLGVQVFERDNKRVLVTPVGQQILDKARAIKLELDDLYQLSHQSHSPLSYPMSVGVIPTIGPYLLPKVLPAVRSEYPGFQMTIDEDQSRVLVEKVRNGELDTAVLALPYETDGLHCFEFWEEDLYLVTHRDDLLAREDSVRSEQLEGANLLLLRDGHCLKDHALAACRLRPSELEQSLGGASLYTLIQMVAGRMGSTLVPAMALDQLLAASSELAAIPLAEPGPHRRIAFITRLNYAGVNDIELLRSLFRRELEKAARLTQKKNHKRQ